MKFDELKEYINSIQAGESVVVDPLLVLNDIKDAVEVGKVNYEDFGISSEEIESFIHLEVLRKAWNCINFLKNYEIVDSVEGDANDEINNVNNALEEVYELVEQYGLVWEELNTTPEELKKIVANIEKHYEKLSSGKI